MFNKKKVVLSLLLIIFAILSGCNLEDKISSGTTKAGEQQKVEVTENTDKGNNKYTVDELSKSILSNDKEMVSKIIQSKTVDINQKNSEGKYPIELVLVMGNCEVAEMLLDAGADSRVVSSDGITVYDIAVNMNNKTLNEIFEKHK